ncbi:hypothetical protein O9992_24155 [Vibrio lentus]|nr:hypothetical protein [Vibrio lentus]
MLVQNNVVRTLNILAFLYALSDKLQQTQSGRCLLSACNNLSQISGTQRIAQRFNVVKHVITSLSCHEDKTTLWGFNFNHPKPHTSLIAGLVSRQSSLTTRQVSTCNITSRSQGYSQYASFDKRQSPSILYAFLRKDKSRFLEYAHHTNFRKLRFM